MCSLTDEFVYSFIYNKYLPGLIIYLKLIQAYKNQTASLVLKHINLTWTSPNADLYGWPLTTQ